MQENAQSEMKGTKWLTEQFTFSLARSFIFLIFKISLLVLFWMTYNAHFLLLQPGHFKVLQSLGYSVICGATEEANPLGWGTVGGPRPEAPGHGGPQGDLVQGLLESASTWDRINKGRKEG